MPSCSNRRDTFYIATIAFDDLDLSLIQDELNGFSLSREPARRAVVFSARIKTERRGAVFVVLRNLRRGATVDLAPKVPSNFCSAIAAPLRPVMSTSTLTAPVRSPFSSKWGVG